MSWPPCVLMRMEVSSPISARLLATGSRRPSRNRPARDLSEAMPLSAILLGPSWRRSSTTGRRSSRRTRRPLLSQAPKTMTSLSMRNACRISSRRSLSSERSQISRTPSCRLQRNGSSRRSTICTPSTLRFLLRTVNWLLPSDTWPSCLQNSPVQRWRNNASARQQEKLELLRNVSLLQLRHERREWYLRLLSPQCQQYSP